MLRAVIEMWLPEIRNRMGYELFTRGVFSTPIQGDEMDFLGPGEIGLLAAESALSLRNLYSLSGTGTDEIRFEFGNHS